jgi:hypothetical protein
MPSDQRTSIHLPESLRVHAFRGVHPFPHSLNPSCMSTNPRAFPSEAKLQRVNSHGRFAIARRAGSLRRSTHARESEEAIIPSLPVSRLQCYSFTDLEREKGREGEHVGREHSCAPTTHLAHSELRLFMAASLHLLLPLPCLLFFSFDASLKRFLLPFACSLPRFAPPRRRMAPPGLAALLLPVFPLA